MSKKVSQLLNESVKLISTPYSEKDLRNDLINAKSRKEWIREEDGIPDAKRDQKHLKNIISFLEKVQRDVVSFDLTMHLVDFIEKLKNLEGTEYFTKG